jgi:hypothetical protein
MQVGNRKAVGTLLVALINGILGGISVLIAIQLYKRLGWSLFGSMAIISMALMFGATPVTSRIMRRFSEGTHQSTPVDPPN